MVLMAQVVLLAMSRVLSALCAARVRRHDWRRGKLAACSTDGWLHRESRHGGYSASNKGTVRKRRSACCSMVRTRARRRSAAVALVQVLGARDFNGVTNISSAISLDSWLTRISGNTPARRTAHRLK